MTKKSENVEAVASLADQVKLAEHVLDTPFCIEQAAHVLDEAMQMARDLKDPNAALEVASGWLTLAGMLDADDELPNNGHKTGFHHE